MEGLILLGLIVIVVFLVVYFERLRKQKILKDEEEDRKKTSAMIDRFVSEVDQLYDELSSKEPTAIESDIKLSKGENLYCTLNPVEWRETRKLRSNGISEDILTPLDEGVLYVTNKGFFFRGMDQNKKFSYEKLISISSLPEGIILERETGKNITLLYNFKIHTRELAMILHFYGQGSLTEMGMKEIENS
jgi:hypothetical protein